MHMKKHIRFIALGLLGVTLTFASCKKDEVVNDTNNTIQLAMDETVESLVDSLEDFMLDPFVSEATELEDVMIESIPEVLDADYFTFVETRGGKKDSMIRSCSGVFKILAANKEKLRRAYLAKMDCMKDNKKALRKYDSTVRAWAMLKRREVLDKHKSAVGDILASFRKGDITERERDANLSAAKKATTEALIKIRVEVRQRIKNIRERAAAAGIIKNCEKTYLRAVYNILGKENYAKWVKCHKMNYRKKRKK